MAVLEGDSELHRRILACLPEWAENAAIRNIDLTLNGFIKGSFWEKPNPRTWKPSDERGKN